MEYKYGQYPVGAVCELIAVTAYPEILGAELTILEPLRVFKDVLDDKDKMGYPTDLTHKGNKIWPPHHALRLKRLPPHQEHYGKLKMKNLMDNLPNLDGEICEEEARNEETV